MQPQLSAVPWDGIISQMLRELGIPEIGEHKASTFVSGPFVHFRAIVERPSGNVTLKC